MVNITLQRIYGDTGGCVMNSQVTKASGVGEYRVAVRGPVKGDVGEGFLLPKARPTDMGKN